MAELDEVETLAERIRKNRGSGKAVKAKLQVDDRVLARVTDGIYRRPSSAFRELISNAYDADATEVVVSTDAPRFERIVIRDNGRGMSPEALDNLVNHIGGSSKRTHKGKELGTVSSGDASLSVGGRRLIGKIGIGLFSVAQLTQHFQVITKRKGDPFRTSAVIVLKTHTEEMLAQDSAGQVYETGEVTITSQVADDIDTQGTEIILMNLRPQARELLQSRDRWQSLDRAANDDGEGAPPPPPSFHIGRVEPANVDNYLMPPQLPWQSSDSPEGRFRKLYAAVRQEVRSRKATPVLEESLDEYLGMLWLLSLAVPVRYIDKHPFDLTSDDGIGFFNITTRGTETVDLLPDETIGARLGLNPTEDPMGGFRVLVDDVELLRPVSFDSQLHGNSGIGQPLMFFGKVASGLGAVPPEIGGGDLSFEAYLYWNQKINPKENNGVLTRINNASGVLFDQSFMNYQVSELTRLRQLTSEVFITEGLDQALNIDRESFNYSHPHYQFLQKWVHYAVRQATNRLKQFNKEILTERRLAERMARVGAIEMLVDTIWLQRRGSDAEPPPEVQIVSHSQQMLMLSERDRGVLVFGESVLGSAAGETQNEASIRIQALVKVLSAYNLLEGLTYSDQEKLISDISAVFQAAV